MLGDKRRSFGIVSEPEPAATVTQRDVERFLALVDLLSNKEKTKALAVEAQGALAKIGEAKAAEVKLAELKEQHAAAETAHRAKIDSERGAWTEEVRQGRAEIEADRRAAAQIKTEAESDRAAAAKDKAEAARRLRVMSGEAA